MAKKINQRDLEGLKREELYQLAQEFKIKGRSKMAKAELIEALKSFVPVSDKQEKTTIQPGVSKEKAGKKEKTASKSTARTKKNQIAQENLPELPVEKPLTKSKEKDSNPKKSIKQSKKNSPDQETVLKNTKAKKAETAKPEPKVEKAPTKRKKAAAENKKTEPKETTEEPKIFDSSRETLSSDKSSKESILSLSFAKEKKESSQRNKKGAVVESVAIPVELITSVKPEQPSPKARQIEEERSRRHASLKTTMEIPVFSAPAPEIAKPVSEEDLTGDLPSDYGETRIVVQIRDPHWAHAYWQIPRSELKRLEMQVGIFEFAHSHFVLRIHNVSDGFTQEFSLSEHARSHYIYLENANTVYQAELGLQSPTEGYTFIALSNIIQTPPDRVSSNWAIPVTPKSSSGDDDRIAGHALPEKPEEVLQTSPVEEITEPEKVFQKAISTGTGLPALFNASGESGRPGVPAPVIPSEDEKTFPAPVSSFEAPKPVSSFEIPSPAAGSFVHNPSQSKIADTDIFLTATPELILYGMVDKRCLLDFNGQKVQVEPDGSFSMRFVLPVNQQKSLELQALEPESGKTRTIRATVKFEVL
jgi:hypothetical protein